MNKTGTLEKEIEDFLGNVFSNQYYHRPEAREDLRALLAKQRQAILEEVREKVIGEDSYDETKQNISYSHSVQRNKLKAEERIRLEELEKEI